MKNTIKGLGLWLVVGTGMMIHIEISTWYTFLFVLFPVTAIVMELGKFYYDNK